MIYHEQDDAQLLHAETLPLGLLSNLQHFGILLQCADTVIYERLAHSHPLNDKLKEITQQHMEDFGSAGLRTLCLSYTELDPDFYDK